MAGSVAGTIQGEAGSDPTAQFAVASTIFNRLKAGSYGGTASQIVNAPNQYVGAATPNASAQQFAQAIEDGSLPQLGEVGNAVNFQQAGSNTTLGRSAGAVNIGGNNFSDQFGEPTQNFVPPQFGGSSGGSSPPMSFDAPGFVPGGGTATTLQPGEADYGAGPGDPTGNQSLYPGGTGSGDPMLPPTAAADPGNPYPTTGGAAAIAAGLPQIGAFISNWAVRGGLILLGIVLIAAAAFALASESKTVQAGAATALKVVK
jgi:hypothetical protein